jgi:DNA repair photolyase
MFAWYNEMDAFAKERILMHYADYKTILSPKNGMNIYRGCTHGCIYCDSRSECYQMKHDFEDIEVKRDAPLILEEQLRRKRVPAMISTGAMCDPYTHLEEELQMTRRCLEVIEKYGFGLAIQTKSTRILRDMDLLKAINENAKCVAQMTLTTFDEDLCRVLEPHVSTTSERFAALEAMKEAGIPTVVWLSPILPFINDTDENLRGVLSYCIHAKVRGIICFGFGVTLRRGDREYFYKKLDERFPGMKRKYMAAFGDSYECSSPNHARLWRIFSDECSRHSIAYRMEDVFSYLRKFEMKERQLSLFEGLGDEECR